MLPHETRILHRGSWSFDQPTPCQLLGVHEALAHLSEEESSLLNELVLHKAVLFEWDRAFDADREALLSALPEQGIGLLMNPGCSLVSSRAASALASRYDYIYAAVGSHPDAADEVNDVTLEEYRTLCKLNPKIKAIGEIGLDYHYEDIPRERQQAAFRAQMALARELNLPVIVHEREAHEDGIRIVEEFPEVTGVFHCYSGSAEMAKWLISRGWYIGFTGVLTFKNARKAVETAATWIPVPASASSMTAA